MPTVGPIISDRSTIVLIVADAYTVCLLLTDVSTVSVGLLVADVSAHFFLLLQMFCTLGLLVAGIFTG